MAPTKTTPKTSPNGEAPALTVESVSPPPKAGRAASAFPKDAIDALAEFIADGKWGGDGQTYESRQAANTRITRLKRALIHYGHYTQAKQIKSRVWQDGDVFRLALTDRNAAA